MNSFAFPSLESLEARRLLAADLTFGDFALSGAPLFTPGGTTDVIVIVRSQTLGRGSVVFKYVDVGFRPESVASFDDPAAVELSTTAITGVTVGPAGKSFTFPLTFSSNLGASRYVLLGKVSGTTASADDVVQSFGTVRVMPRNGNLVVAGSDGDDHISVAAIQGAPGKAQYDVNANGYTESFSSTKVKAITVEGKAGNDVIVASGAVPVLKINGGDGDDKLVGGDGNDTLSGGAGGDSIYAGEGNDRLNGNGGNDRLYGEAGADHLYGYAGNDYMDGGSSSDRLDGGNGHDTMYGQGGNDRFFSQDSTGDTLFGGGGTDTATHDTGDVLSSI